MMTSFCSWLPKVMITYFTKVDESDIRRVLFHLPDYAIYIVRRTFFC